MNYNVNRVCNSFPEVSQLKNPRMMAVISALLALLAVVFLAGLTWANYRYCQKNPGGNDFLVHWMGTRVFMKEGLSPYSDETAQRIQVVAYGHVAQPGEHELRVAYPLYSELLFLPFALIDDFAMARAVWMTFLEAGILLLSFLSLRIFRWRPGLGTLVGFFLFSMLWYHAVRPLINGNAIILVALALVGGVLAIKSGQEELAGFLFAISTIKPQVVLVPIVCLLVWAMARKHWRLVAWFAGVMVMLVMIGLLFLPSWPLENLREVLRYPGYNPPGTPGAAFAVWLPARGMLLGRILSVLLILMLLFEWLNAIRRRDQLPGLFWTVSLTLVASQWIGIQTDPGNFIVVFPALVCVAVTLEERWRRLGRGLVWVMLLVIGVGGWWIFLSTVQYGAQPQQSPVMFFPLPALLLILLYWVRWWAIRPPKVLFDRIAEKEYPQL